MKKPMKKLFSILLAVVMFCTVFVGMDMSVAARSTEDIGNDVIKQIEGAQEGATITVNLERGARFQREVVIRKSITVNFIGKYIAGGVHLDDDDGNRVFNIKADNVTLNFGTVRFTNRCREHSDGGAIYIDGNNATITGGVFGSCCSLGNDGGTIYINGKNATVSGSQFIGGAYFNEDFYSGKDTTGGASQGGAIYINDTGAKIENCRFTNCAAKKEGGAIYANKDRASILNCIFKDCVSHSNDGGAIFTNADDIKIENCSFENCSAKGSNSNGGAICAGYYTDRLIVEGCKFTNCNAGSGRGHWVYGREISDKNTIVHCSKPYSSPNYVECILGSALDCKASDLRRIDNNKPSCTKDGVKPYWECFCGNRFSASTPSEGNRISNLDAWKSGAGKDPATGHDFTFTTAGETLTGTCQNDSSHRVSLTLMEKDTIYPGNPYKTPEQVVSGDIAGLKWDDFAPLGLDYDLYYINTKTGNKTDTSDGATQAGYPPKNAGSYALVLEVTKDGTHVPDAKIQKSFTIAQKPLTSQMVTLEPYSVIEGSSERPSVIVKDGGTVLSSSTDYDVAGDTTVTAVGIYDITVTGQGNYTSSVTKTWYITEHEPLEFETENLTATSITYGQPLSESHIIDNGCVVKSDTEQVFGTFNWENPDIVPEKAGEAEYYTAVFTPNTEFSGYGILKTEIPVNVQPVDLSGRVTIHTPERYTGQDLTGHITVTYGSELLVKGVDYEVTGPLEVIKPGNYTASVKFMGNYSGTATQPFTVYRYLTEKDLTFSIDDTYESDDAGDAVIIKLDDGTTLERGVDYEIEGVLDESKAPIEYQYPATITFMGFYKGTDIQKTFIVTYPQPTPEPEPEPEPEPVPPTSDATIDDGVGNSPIDISVTVRDHHVIISDIPESTIESVVNASSDPNIVIDISKITYDNEGITGVSISKSTAEAIVRALQSPDNEKNSLVIKTNAIIFKLNTAALASITRQAEGETIQMVVDYKDEGLLNDNQRAIIQQLSASSQKSVEGIFEVYIESDGTRITSFEGGEIIVGKSDFTIPDGKSAEHYFVYYLPEGGQEVRHSTWVESGVIYFRTSHLSDYAIVYDKNMTNDTNVPVNIQYILRSPATGE